MEPNTSASPAAATSDRMGDYRLLRAVARGSQGEVWLAEDMVGKRMALKVLRLTSGSGTNSSREENALRLFRTVVQDHPNLVQIFHVGQDEGRLFYSMELADSASGEDDQYTPMTLAGLLSDRKPLPTSTARAIIQDVLAGLSALHARGLVHRDVKPSNILRVGGVWKLADIGLLTEERTEVTALGTVEFIPPSGPIDKTSDLYACGRVLYCMLTGLPARSFPTLPGPLLASGSADFRALNSVVNKACQLETARRFQTAQAFLIALQNSAKNTPRLLWAALSLLLLASISAAGVATYRSQNHSGQQTPAQSAWKQLFNGHDLSGWSKPKPIHGTWFVENGTIRCVKNAEFKLLRSDESLGPGVLRVVMSPDHDGARLGIRYAGDQRGGGSLFMLMGDKYTWLRGYQSEFPSDEPGNWFSFPGPIPKTGENVTIEVEWGPQIHQLRANGQVLYDLPPSSASGPMMLHVWGDDSGSFKSVEYAPTP